MMHHTSIRFCKMHGLGNDFIVVDTINQNLTSHTLPVQLMADRHFGIGCDQLLLIETSTKANFFCRILNADGSEAEQCGNGLRCVGRYVHEQGLYTGTNLAIETVAGVFPVEVSDYDHIRVELAATEVSPALFEIPLPSLETTITGSALSLGNPHFIIKVDNLTNTPIGQLGSLLSSHSHFPHGTNVGFVETLDSQHIRLRTYERGAGETNACGSNACAAAIVGMLDGSLACAVNVEFKHGKLVIEWEGEGKPVYMTGPASLVFAGEFLL